MTADELYEAWCLGNIGLTDIIAAVEARDREIQTWKDTVLDRTYDLSQAKLATWRWWKQARQNNYAAWAHLRNLERTLQAGEDCEQEVKEYAFLFELADKRTHEAIAAWREATGRHNVSPDLGVLLEWLLKEREELAKWCHEATEERDEAIAKAEKLAEALEQYADKRNWRRAYDGQGHLNVFQADTNGPYAALDALAAYRENTQEETDG